MKKEKIENEKLHRYSVYLNDEQLEVFSQNADKCCMTKSNYARQVLCGLLPQQKNENVDKFLSEVHKLGININQLCAKANSLGYVDTPELKNQLEKLEMLELEIQAYLTQPIEFIDRWQ